MKLFFIIRKSSVNLYQKYIRNCYSLADLHIQGGRSIKSDEGTAQCDPTAMAVDALGITLAWLQYGCNSFCMAKRKIKIKQIDDHINSLSLQVIDRRRYSKDVKGMVETRRRRKKIGYNNVNAEDPTLLWKINIKSSKFLKMSSPK